MDFLKILSTIHDLTKMSFKSTWKLYLPLTFEFGTNGTKITQTVRNLFIRETFSILLLQIFSSLWLKTNINFMSLSIIKLNECFHWKFPSVWLTRGELWQSMLYRAKTPYSSTQSGQTCPVWTSLLCNRKGSVPLHKYIQVFTELENLWVQ